MTTTQVVSDPRWRRGAEDLYPSKNMDASLQWTALDGGSWDMDATGVGGGELLSGMVVTVVDGNVIAKANGGRFRGIVFNEVSRDINESLGGNRPAVIRGDATVRILNKSLDPDEEYAEGDLLTSADGRLVPAASGAVESTICGVVQRVNADSITFTQFPATI